MPTTQQSKTCLDCGVKKSSRKGKYCKLCGYKHRVRPSGLKYKISKWNPSWFGNNNPSSKYKPRVGVSPWNKGTRGVSKKNSGSFTTERVAREKNYNWSGGKTSTRKMMRQLRQYIEWRDSVYKRDGYTCQKCGKVGGALNADHVIPFSVLLDENKIKTRRDAENCKELWNIKNGRTLCVPCHKNTPTYAGRANRI